MTYKLTSTLFLIGTFHLLVLGQSIETKASIQGLLEQAYIASQIDYKKALADSLSQASIEYARSEFNDDLIHEAYSGLINRDRFISISKLSDDHIQEAQKNNNLISDPLIKFQFWIDIAKKLNAHKDRRSIDFSQKALAYSNNCDDEDTKIKAFLSMAESTLINGKKKESYENYLYADGKIALMDDEIKKRIYQYQLQDLLAIFYYASKSFNKVIEVRKAQIDSIQKHTPIDSLKLMHCKLQLYLAVVKNGEKINLTKPLTEILDYALSNNNKLIEEEIYSLFSTNFLDNGNLKANHKLFYNKMLNDIKNGIDVDSSPSWIFNKALFFEYDKKLDSAEIYFKQTIKQCHVKNKKYREANYCSRFGEFYIRHKKDDLAFRIFEDSYNLQLSNDIIYDENILKVTDQLHQLASAQGNHEKAYDYLTIYNQYHNKIQKSQSDEQIVLMEIKSDKLQKDQLQSKNDINTRRKHNIQYFAIAIALILFLLILIIISSTSVSVWVIEAIGFFSILFIFEFIVLILDEKIHHWAHAEPIKIFLVKIVILSILYPLHHKIEHVVTKYLIKNQLINKPSGKSIRNMLEKLYPFLSKKTKDTAE